MAALHLSKICKFSIAMEKIPAVCAAIRAN